MHFLDSMPKNSVGGVLASMISRCCGVLFQCWCGRCLFGHVTLSEILTLLCTSPADTSSLASGTRVMDALNWSNHRL